MDDEYFDENDDAIEDSIPEVSDVDTVIEDDADVKIYRHDELGVDKVYENYYSKEKRTSPFLSKYERTKIIGVRMQQLAEGAKPVIDITALRVVNPRTIAMAEFVEKCIPLMIRRYLPDNTYEDWRLSDLYYNATF